MKPICIDFEAMNHTKWKLCSMDYICLQLDAVFQSLKETGNKGE